jgi:hypothetical protein
MRKNQFWLSDEQRERIEPHLPTDVRGVERKNDRRVISGIVHVLKSGCRWARITVTPISRPVVKMPSNFFGSASCQRLSLVASSCRARTAPVSSVDGCVRITDRARHPSGSSIGPSEACALAA